MALYDVQDHPFLSPKTKDAKSGSFDSQQILAESLLGLKEPVLTSGRNLEEMEVAIVLQINFQVEQGIDPFVESAVSSSHTHQSVVYRDRMVDPRAALMVERINSRLGVDPNSGFGDMVSYRTNADPA